RARLEVRREFGRRRAERQARAVHDFASEQMVAGSAEHGADPERDEPADRAGGGVAGEPAEEMLLHPPGDLAHEGLRHATPDDVAPERGAWHAFAGGL